MQVAYTREDLDSPALKEAIATVAIQICGRCADSGVSSWDLVVI